MQLMQMFWRAIIFFFVLITFNIQKQHLQAQTSIVHKIQYLLYIMSTVMNNTKTIEARE